MNKKSLPAVRAVGYEFKSGLDILLKWGIIQLNKEATVQLIAEVSGE